MHLHTHLAETLDEERFCLELFGHRPVAYMETLGWVGPDVWFAHSVHVNDAEIHQYAQTGCGVDAEALWEDGEVRALITLVVLTSLALSGCMLAAGGTLGPALAGDAAFLAISAQTTTGFATVPVGDLSAAAKLILIVSMAMRPPTGL